MLEMPVENVHVVGQFVGGGFGCKGTVWPHPALAAVAARPVGRPVQLALTRAQMYTSVGYRSPTRHRLSLGAPPDGKLTPLPHPAPSHTPPSAQPPPFPRLLTPPP